MIHEKEIDLSAQKDELGWQNTMDKFFLEATPKVFEWLRWAITLAALTYVQRISNSKEILSVLYLTYAFVGYYFLAYFSKFKFTGFPFFKNKTIILFISWFISGLLTYFTYSLVMDLVNAVALSQR